MSAHVHRLETGYEPEPAESSSEMDELRAEAERIVAGFDPFMLFFMDLYRMTRKVAGDPIR